MTDHIDSPAFPNQLYGWVRENDGTWSLYDPDGTLIIASRNGRAQVSEPNSDFEIANRKYVLANGGTLTVEQGATQVSPASVLNFTAGATVTDAGGGQADVAITGGGSQAVGLSDFAFTEQATAGVYTATFSPPDGCVVIGGRFYLLTAWAADEALVRIGDGSEATGYLKDLAIVNDLGNTPYDPTNNTGNAGSAVPFPNNNVPSKGDYFTGSFDATAPAGLQNASGGVLYGASFSGLYVPATGPITMTITTTIASPPVVPTGTALIRLLYYAPATATAAIFA